MKTHFRYIYFQQFPRGDEIGCYNKKSRALIGTVEYFPTWRQYVMTPEWGTVWSSGCADDVAAFLRSVNAIRAQNGRTRSDAVGAAMMAVGDR